MQLGSIVICPGYSTIALQLNCICTAVITLVSFIVAVVASLSEVTTAAVAEVVEVVEGASAAVASTATATITANQHHYLIEKLEAIKHALFSNALHDKKILQF